MVMPVAAGSESHVVVATDSGPVTLVELAGLRGQVNALQQQAASLAAVRPSLLSLAAGLWRQRGKLLVERAAAWVAPSEMADLMRLAEPLEQGVEVDDAKLQSIHGQ